MARRRGRKPSEYRRRGPVREPYDYILIICEGGKTEPNYFKRLCAVHGLSNANVEITGADGTDPVSVVNFAVGKHDEHDRVYCVFDRNGHANFKQALQLIVNSELGKKGVLRAVTSTPCFEVWVLLHYAYSMAPFSAVGNESSCDRVLKAIKPHFSSYSKGNKNVYDALSSKLEQATKNAKQLTKYNRGSGSINPATDIHDLVEYLRKLKPKKAMA